MAYKTPTYVKKPDSKQLGLDFFALSVIPVVYVVIVIVVITAITLNEACPAQ